MPRPNVEARLGMLTRALQGGPSNLPEPDKEQLLRVVLLITSPMSWLYWKDYLGLNAEEAADLGAWAIRHLAACGAQVPE
jgi:hypothetical protein